MKKLEEVLCIMWFVELVGGVFLISCMFAGVKRTIGLGKTLVDRFYDWAEAKVKKD